MPDAAAIVRAESEFYDSQHDFYIKNMLSTIFTDCYGLTVSDDAIYEIAKNAKGSSMMPKKYLDADADIILFKPFNDILDESVRDIFIAHEIWHLIEQEKGLMKEHPLIIEGTATYAARRFARKRCDKILEEFESYYPMLYLGAANIVQTYVENTDNPFVTVLDISLREKMQTEFIQRIKPVLYISHSNMLKDEEYRKSVTTSMMQVPEFKKVVGNLNKDTLLEIYKRAGLIKLAGELETQNLDKYLELLRSFVF